MPVLVFPADHDGELAAISQRHVAHQNAAVRYIIACPVCAQILIHGVEPLARINMVDVIDLAAHGSAVFSFG